MSSSDTKYAHQEPSSGGFLISFFALLGCLLIFAVILAVAYIPNRAEPLDQDIVEERKTKLAELRATAKKNSRSYKWIDQEAGTVQLPIDRAVELTIPKLNTKE